MKEVVIASDSTTDLGSELIQKYNIQILPLGVHLGEEHYTDGVDIHPDDIYKHYQDHKELPKTSAVNIADFHSYFEKETNQGKSIVLFTISGDMSSTYNNARITAAQFEDVYVVDTRNLSTGGGLLVLHACEMAEHGASASEIAQECTKLTEHVDASFVIDDLEFLHKGGRCSALAALGANVLHIKPCISVKNGKLGVAKKYRGKFNIVLKQYIADRIGDGRDILKENVFITHAGCDEQIYRSCIDQVTELLPDAQVHLTRAGCTVSAHCGKNTLGVLFIRKHPIE